MPIEIGQKIPDVKLKTMSGGEPRDISTAELFRGKRAVLFAVPGAFTATCSEMHLPGFVDYADELKAKGVEVLACTAVNDIFVLSAWSKDHGADGKVTLLADGNGDLARALGMELDARGFGMGVRSQRYAVLLEDGLVKAVGVDAPSEVKKSSAEAILQAL
ncbi:MAG: peroxiredoxin [Acidobacteriota bacterium]|nr:peroxiredoxin [Acidobacteriota bacterium]